MIIFRLNYNKHCKQKITHSNTWSKSQSLRRNLEAFWADILSKDRRKILNAIHSVPKDEKHVVVEHLLRMVHESGWTKGQREGARIALRVLEE
jgi:hypothetical protein